MPEFKYPLYKPNLKGHEKKYVNQCLDSTWISAKGAFVSGFEKNFANYINARFATSTCNGTAAMHLALMALGIKKGDEVIVPTLTYVASVNAIHYCGAIPVFVDSLHDTWQMDPLHIEKNITKKTKAVIAVHLYGYPCEMTQIKRICRENGLFLMEDCAEAVGSYYKKKHVGTFGDIAAFSFYGNKTITTGEGGMVATSNRILYERVIHLKGQGLAQGYEYWHDIIGYNYRMTNISAAIGLAQLERIDDFLHRKANVAEWYKEYLRGTNYIIHDTTDKCIVHSYWMCSVLTRSAKERDELRAYLKSKGIETRPLFSPVHTMPMYKSSGEKYPNAEYLANRGLNLPSYPDLTKKDVRYICNEIINCIGANT